jgi:AraC-like DNA-binding protein
MSAPIKRLGYLPRAIYPLDLEAFTMSELRQRGGREVLTTHQYEFHTLVLVTQGTCTQVVDFEPISCAPGSLLVLRPGQAHNYGHDDAWDGWNVLFRPEFVLPVSSATRSLTLAVDLERLPDHLALRGKELRTVTRAIEQLGADAKFDAPLDDLNALLRHQLHALLTRLCILKGRQQGQAPVLSPALQRFQRFQHLVEERFAQWHQVACYSDRLGYTEKSLTRAVTASTGKTAKAFIAARVVLEAKRLLAHTDLPVATIAERLGFDEATNFGKFFRREAGSTPAAFRRLQRGAT